MTIKLLDGVYDLTDDISDQGVESVSLESLESQIGQIALQKTFNVRDPDGEFSYWSTRGALFVNSWRLADIIETDIDEQQKFFGLITNLDHNITNNGNAITISATEPTGTILEFPVEEVDLVTYGSFLNAGGSSIGDQTMTIDTGTGEIPVNSMVSFGGSLVPRYQINAVSGSPNTTSITLDRPLEKAVANNDALRVAVPVTKTIPGAISDALTAAGMGAYLGPSFDELDTSDTANGYLIWMHIVQEKNITLKSHLSKLLELGDLYLTKDSEGILNVFRGLAWDQSIAPETITHHELLTDLKLVPDFSRVVIGYETLYITAGGEVAIASGNSNQEFIDEYSGVKLWQPLTAKTQLTVDYSYLYNDSATADFYGQSIIDYFSVPRWIVQGKLKTNYTGDPYLKLDLLLGKTFNMDLNFGNGTTLEQEPVTCIAYTKDKNNDLYTGFKLAMTNQLQPGFSRSQDTILPPVLLWTAKDAYDLYIAYTPSESLNIARYEFQVGNDSTFTDFETYYDSGSLKSSDYNFSIQVQQVLSRKFVRVKAIDESGNYSAWSNILDTNDYKNNRALLADGSFLADGSEIADGLK